MDMRYRDPPLWPEKSISISSCSSTVIAWKSPAHGVCERKNENDIPSVHINDRPHSPTTKDIKPPPKEKAKRPSISPPFPYPLSPNPSNLPSHTHLREILILTLNLLLDPQQHGSLPLVQFLHLIELEQTVCENVLIAGFDCFFEIVEELEFAGRGELCVFGAVFVKGAGGGYHVLWRKGVRRGRCKEGRKEVGGKRWVGWGRCLHRWLSGRFRLGRGSF